MKRKNVFSIILFLAIIAFAFMACLDDSNGIQPGHADKTLLIAEIEKANDAKKWVATNTDAANVPYGVSWVTAGVMATFEAAIETAEAVNKNAAATQASVDYAESTLAEAIRVFNSAKGTGTKDPTHAVITINEITGYADGTIIIGGGLFDSIEDVKLGEHPAIFFNGEIQNGTAIMHVYNLNDGNPWNGAGSKYLAFSIESDSAMGLDIWISKTEHHFGLDPAPTLPFTNFEKMALFSITAEEILLSISGGEITFEIMLEEFKDFFEGSLPTWKEFSLLLTGGRYECLEEEINIEKAEEILIRKDPGLNTKFLPGDIITANTTMYSNAPFWIGRIGGGDRGPKIGEISGTINLIDIPSGLSGVYISVSGNRNNNNLWWGSRSSKIETNGTSFLIPIHENDFNEREEIDPYQNWDCFFRLYVDLGQNKGFEIFISGSYPVDLSSYSPEEEFDINVGSISSTPISLAYTKLNGTVSITSNGIAVPHLRLNARSTTGGNELGSARFNSTGTTTAWEMYIPKSNSEINITFRISGYPGINANWENRLFEISPASFHTIPAGADNVTNITLNIGDVEPGTGLNGGGSSWQTVPYILDGATLSFNPTQSGQNGVVYLPTDPNCPKWVLEGTGGTFPVGKWMSTNNSTHNSGFNITWIEFDVNGNMMRHQSSEYTRAITHDQGMFTAGGTEYPYILDGNTLTFNPMQRGDGTAFLPTDPRCDKYVLKPGTEGVFPVGIWIEQNSGNNNAQVEFTSGGDMIYSYINESPYEYELQGNNIMLRWAGN